MQNQNTQNQIAAIANENHSYSPVGGFLPSLNKAGKVTSTAEKRAILLNSLDSKGIQALAVNGRGQMQKQAAQALAVDSLATLLASETPLSGGQIASLRAFLISAYGESLYNRQNHKGLSGLIEYLGLVIRKLEIDQATAETATAQSRLLKKLATVRSECASVERLLILRDDAIAGSAIAAPTATTKAPKATTTAPKAPKATTTAPKATTN